MTPVVGSVFNAEHSSNENYMQVSDDGNASLNATAVLCTKLYMFSAQPAMPTTLSVT